MQLCMYMCTKLQTKIIIFKSGVPYNSAILFLLNKPCPALYYGSESFLE